MLEWCSISVITISSPGRRNFRPQAAATRLIASVVLRVNTISAARGALMKAATLARTSSYRAVASSASVWMPRWMLALCQL